MTQQPAPEITREELANYIGQTRKSNTWMTITQPMIDAFADATYDHQFIHIDPERARQTPFGTTVAHGFFTLSLIPKLMEPVSLVPSGVVMGVNYGLNKVRFPNPVKVNSEIRAIVTLRELNSPSPERVLMTSDVEVEIKGEAKPAVVAQSLALFVFG